MVFPSKLEEDKNTPVMVMVTCHACGDGSQDGDGGKNNCMKPESMAFLTTIRGEGDYSKLLLAQLVLYALYQKKTENIFLKIKFSGFTPATRGFKNCKNAL